MNYIKRIAALAVILLITGGFCMSKDVLTEKELSIAKISSCTAAGDIENLEKELTT